MSAFVPSSVPSFGASIATSSSVCSSSFQGARVVAKFTPSKIHRPSTIRMGIEDDMAAAQQCLEDGCPVNTVQDILARLEARRNALDKESAQISGLMFELAKANVAGDRGIIAEVIESAMKLFSKAEDNYPAVGSPSPWTMDKPKKK